MSEQPIERLNYFNGQRLEAVDFRLEQEFHIRTQRWLSKSLFSAGVADGLDVSAVEDPATGKKTKVRVTEGLALDDLGRAIILVAPVELLPQARFLCVRYTEYRDRVQESECTVRGAATGTVARSKGPERIVSDAEFTWRAVPPANDERELIIAELELATDCTVARVVSGARRWAVATQVSKVFTYALEGEKEIDGNAANQKLLRFHVTGRTPNSVSLCLRARQFSPLYYTEMGSHKHTAAATAAGVGGRIKTDVALGIDEHQHIAATTGPDLLTAPSHSHSITAAAHLEALGTDGGGLDVSGQFIKLDKPSGPDLAKVVTTILNPIALTTAIVDFFGTLLSGNRKDVYAPVVLDQALTSITISGGSSTVTGFTAGLKPRAPGAPELHRHFVDVSVGMDPEGATGPAQVRTAAQLTYFSNLKVSIDGSDPDDTTAAILAQIAQSQSGAWNGQTALNGGVGLPLSTRDGTGLIRLDLLGLPGVSFGPGVHEIAFSVAAGTGGCLQYNLYVE
jgi:hypothetical protein